MSNEQKKSNYVSDQKSSSTSKKKRPVLDGTKNNSTSTTDDHTSTIKTSTSTSDNRTSTTQTSTSTPDNGSSTIRTSTSISDKPTSTTQTSASTSENRTSTTQNSAFTLNNRTFTTQNSASTLNNRTSTTHTLASTSDNRTSTTQTSASTPDHRTSTTQTSTSTPDHRTSTTQTSVSTPDYRTSTTQTLASTPVNPIKTLTSTPKTFTTSSEMSSSRQSLIPLRNSSTCALFLKQLSVMLWKSMIVRRVHFISTFFELLGPILVVLIGAWLHSQILTQKNQLNPGGGASEIKPAMFYDKMTLYKAKEKVAPKMEVWYAPNNTAIQKLFDSLRQVSQVKVTGVHNETSLETEISAFLNRTNGDPMPPGLAVYIKHLDLPKGQINFRVYLPCSKEVLFAWTNLYPEKNNQGPVDEESTKGPFVMLASLIAYVGRDFLTQLNISSKKASISAIYLNRMPYPSYRKSQNLTMKVFNILALYLVTSYVVVCPLMVKRITDEKSTKSKELLRMVGMSDLVFWSSHFITYFIPIVIHSLGITVILFYFPNPFFTYCSKSLFFFFLTLFGIQLILFSMLITTVFNRPVVAVMVTGILWLVLSATVFHFLVPGNAIDFDVSATNFARMLTSFLPTSSLLWLVSIIGCFESLNRAISWDNFDEPTPTYHNFTTSTVVMSILLSYPIYTFFIWYLDNVWPFQVGVPKSPFFFLRPSYWCPRPRNKKKKRVDKPELNSAVHEPDPVSLKPSIEVQDVCKVYRSGAQKKFAVDHLWLNIYHKQITVLLGHNGAGKTTTMNMITGLNQSSSGVIYVNGFNVFTQTKQARRSIGLCPQENIIFNELTVYQHLRLFAILKDFPDNEVEQEVAQVIKLLQLRNKQNVFATNLSGGMKRKLALGIALVGGTKILILDEPTSGMDPEARRVIWDLLISIRRQRTILLTTHYMEEADVLGDRIAIMNEGKLCCSGSPFFLKNVFGTGYQLRVEKQRKFKSHLFEQVLQKYVPTASLKTEIETEVIYNFNLKANNKRTVVSDFPAMFQDLETNREEYRINSFGLSYSTLEDVFLRVGSDSMATTDGEPRESVKSGIAEGQTVMLTMNSELLKGSALLINQLKALFLKRFHFAKRYWNMVIIQLLVPSIIILIALKIDGSIRSSFSTRVNEIRLNLSDMYGSDSRAFYSGPQDLGTEYLAVSRDKHSAQVHSLDSCIAARKEKEINFAFAKCLLASETSLNLALYSRKYVTGLAVGGENSYTIWYNTEQSLSLPLSMMSSFEAMARHRIIGSNLKSNVVFGIDFRPLLITGNKKESEKLEKLALQLFITWAITCLVFLPIAFPFLASSYILFPIREQVTKCKLLQLMTGLSPTLFWIANFIFDLLNHLVTILLFCTLIFLLDFNGIFFGTNSKNSGTVLFVILMSFGVGSIPMAYISSYFFKTPTVGFVSLLITSLVLGLPINMVMSTIELADIIGFHLFPPYVYFLHLFRLVPIFAMVFGYQKLYRSITMAELCKAVPPSQLEDLCFAMRPGDITYMFVGCCPGKCGDNCYGKGSPFSLGSNGCGTEVVFLLFDGVFLMLLIIFFENYTLKVLKFFSTFKTSSRMARKNVTIEKSVSLGVSSSTTLEDDSDVALEKERIRLLLERGETLSHRHDRKASNSSSNSAIPDLLITNELTKCFGDFMAVNSLTFGVHFHECFGLLGVNGAGKTTTFSMLTGDLLPSSGDAYLASGYSLMHSLRQFRRNIGYCPQFDALLDLLTGEETLYLFARLRGVPALYQKRDVDNLIKMVGLEKHATKQTGDYSGGNRRKLSIALALIGTPPLIFLDEPSAGVDPGARRKIWATLGAVKSNFNSSIILTSHSMEECEALCSRIAIMVSGRFRCLGSTQHLRTKYGQGYSILVRLHRKHELDQAYSDAVQTHLCQALPSAVLRDSHQCLMNFHVPDKAETWSNIFERMARLDQKFKFEDYVVSDTTLENIFITFARSQKSQSK